MNIVLSYNNFEEVLVLPFLPPALTLPEYVHENEEFELISGVEGVGKLNIAGLRGLRVITIESFFANREYSFAKSQLNGWDCVELIKKWSDYRRPIRIIITTNDHREILNMACLTEKFSPAVDRAGDIPFSLELKEFIFPSAPVVE